MISTWVIFVFKFMSLFSRNATHILILIFHLIPVLSYHHQIYGVVITYSFYKIQIFSIPFLNFIKPEKVHCHLELCTIYFLVSISMKLASVTLMAVIVFEQSLIQSLLYWSVIFPLSSMAFVHFSSKDFPYQQLLIQTIFQTTIQVLLIRKSPKPFTYFSITLLP